MVRPTASHRGMEDVDTTQVEVSVDSKSDLVSIMVTSQRTGVQSVVAVPKNEGQPRAGRGKFLFGKSPASPTLTSSPPSTPPKKWGGGAAGHVKGTTSSGMESPTFSRSGEDDFPSPNRRADSLRPLSPNRPNRSSLYDDANRHSSGRRGRDAQSCPPSTNRHEVLQPVPMSRKDTPAPSVESRRAARGFLAGEEDDCRRQLHMIPEIDGAMSHRSRDSSCPPALRSPRSNSNCQPLSRGSHSQQQVISNKGKKPNLVAAASARRGVSGGLLGRRGVGAKRVNPHP